MNKRIAVSFVLLSSIVGCFSSQSLDSHDPVVAEQDSVEPGAELFFSHLNNDHDLQPGSWQEEGGSIICLGYLTRVESEDYCAESVPDDWTPFTFAGQTYYVQPLAGTQLERSE